MKRALSSSFALAVLAAAPLYAQSNANPSVDIELGELFGLSQRGRVGAFPNGTNGLACATTSCNKGSVTVNWLDAGFGGIMDADHPFISFLLAKDDGTRLRQISDYSYVKHGFFALADSQCDPCQGGSNFGEFLGIGCSDTYSANNNGDRFWLGPPDEIDPWLGTWDPFGSYFDQGEPSVGGAAANDGQRTLNTAQANTLGPVPHRMVVDDNDLMDAGSDRFFFQGQYTVRMESESNRWNNTGWRETDPFWSGSSWFFPNVGNLALGSVLEAWDGADVASNTNGTDDGRLYVAVKVTGPVDGLYHYEYAVHNRDNSRGVGALRLPVCGEAQVLNVGFSDIDRNALNQWSFTRNATELVWDTGDNPIGWNSFYNFWFDSDAAPIDGMGVVLDQFSAGAGSGDVTITSRAPMGLYNVDLGPGCSDGTAPRLFLAGSPPRATLGNNSLVVNAIDNAPGTFVAFLYSVAPATTDLGGGCFSYVGVGPPLFLTGAATDASGVATLPISVPLDPGLEGLNANFQVLEFDPLGGPYLDDWDLSNGLRLRVGDSIPTCP